MFLFACFSLLGHVYFVCCERAESISSCGIVTYYMFSVSMWCHKSGIFLFHIETSKPYNGNNWTTDQLLNWYINFLSKWYTSDEERGKVLKKLGLVIKTNPKAACFFYENFWVTRQERKMAALHLGLQWFRDRWC